MARRRLTWLAIGLIPAAFLTAFYLYPMAVLLWRGLAADGGDAIFDRLRSPGLRRVVWFTTWQATISTVLTIVVALPMAHVFARYRFAGRRLLMALTVVPFVLPTVVVATAFLALSRWFGLDDGWLRLDRGVTAIVAAHVFFNYALIVRSVGSYWSQLDTRTEDAARLLGAGRGRVFFEVTLGRLRPSLLAAGAIVFMFNFTSFGVVLLLGGPRRSTLDTEIWRFAAQRAELNAAAALAVIQLVAVVALLTVNSRLQQKLTVSERLADPSSTGRPVTTGAERAYVGSVLLTGAVIIGLPIAALIERSFRVGDGYSLAAYRELANVDQQIPLMQTSPLRALWNSLSFAALAMLIATAIGVLVAVIAANGGRLGTATDVGFLLPLGTSAVTLGFGILIALDEPPLDLRTSVWLIPITHALVGIPFVVRSMTPVLRGIDDRFRQAAALLGASPPRVRREIDLPLVAPALTVGAVFAFAVSLGEFGATAFIARPDRPTVPIAILRLLGRPGELAFGQAMALSVLLMVVTFIAVLAIDRLRTTVASEF